MPTLSHICGPAAMSHSSPCQGLAGKPGPPVQAPSRPLLSTCKATKRAQAHSKASHTCQHHSHAVPLQVTIKHFHAHQSGLPLAKDGTMDILIIENIFYGQDVPRIYDLKGSERSRWSEEDPSVAGSVLMDANLRESNLTAPLLVRACPHWLETGLVHIGRLCVVLVC